MLGVAFGDAWVVEDWGRRTQPSGTGETKSVKPAGEV